MPEENPAKINPHGLCTWKPAAECADCRIQGILKCRHTWGDLLAFVAMTIPAIIAAIAGMVRGGFGVWLYGWLGYALFFFLVWEARILCSHCPYWAREGRTLHCLANHGVIKIWRYHPEPMSRGERFQFLLGVAILCFYPLPFLLIGGEYLLALITFVGVICCAVILRVNTCSRCVNFSCPANAVPKPIVDAYLRRNPVMRRAWEEAGYRLDDPN